MHSIQWRFGERVSEIFEIYEVEFGQFRCRLKSASGKTISVSKSHTPAPSDFVERILRLKYVQPEELYEEAILRLKYVQPEELFEEAV